jgi:hypothetical protein
VRIGVRLLWGAMFALSSMACGNSQVSKAATDPGCSAAPNCGSCLACYDACICQGQSSSACVAKCQTGVGGSSSGNPGTVTIKTTSRTVAAGEEAFFCQNFSNPFGQDVDVLQSESFMTPGSHHMFVFYEQGATDGPLED